VIKKTITYDNYNDESVTEDFYFSISKLEAIELEMEFEGGLEGHLGKLQETENGKDAYYLFKDVVLKAYGKKSLDGKRFIKDEESTKAFEQSNALGELIWGFLTNPTEGAQFIEGCLPAKLVAEAKASATKGEPTQTPELAPAAPVLEEETAKDEPKIDGLTDAEILAKKPIELTQPQLMRAYELKSSQQ
jgi:hypothetical protein